MTRPLSAVALGLVLFGVEVATGAVSLGAVRLWGGLGALFTGDPFILSSTRVVTGIWLLLVGGGLAVTIGYVELQRGRVLRVGNVCPECGAETQRVRRRKRHRLLSRMLEAEVTRRSCPKCSWRGLTA